MMSRKSFVCYCGLIKELFWHFPEWTEEENHKIAQSGELCPAKIQTEHLLDKRLKHYHYTSPDMLLGQWEYGMYTEF
jgi:hypothetical protein